jgi:hypothetical protein
VFRALPAREALPDAESFLEEAEVQTEVTTGTKTGAKAGAKTVVEQPKAKQRVS